MSGNTRTRNQRSGSADTGSRSGYDSYRESPERRGQEPRRKRRSGHSFLFFIIGSMILLIGFGCLRRKSELDALEEQKSALEQTLAEEQRRTEEIEEYSKYIKTRKYIEEVAKDKLGLVHDGETIFKNEDGN